MPLPLMLPLITSGLGAIANMFGGDAEHERYLKYLNMINGQKDQLKKTTEMRKSNLLRLSSSQRQERRANQSAVNQSEGVSGPGTLFGNERDIINSEQQGIGNIDEDYSNKMNALNQQTANAQLEEPIQQNPVVKFIGGGLKGFNLGAGIMDSLKSYVPGGNTTADSPMSVSDSSDNMTKWLKMMKDKYKVQQQDDGVGVGMNFNY